MKYQGVPVTLSTLRNIHWDFLDGKLIKNIDVWICDSTSSTTRLTLLGSYLSGIPSYYMSLFPLNKTVILKLDKHRRLFFWAEKKKKKGYYMVHY
jgi:hypothetical protein